MVTVAILGAGNRGSDSYGMFSKQRPDLMKVVAICDINPDRLFSVAKDLNVAKDKCFLSEEGFFKQEKLTDVLIIATQDRDHYRHSMQAMKQGYDILLEKPISPLLSECLEIEQTARKLNRTVIVCHVARYMIYFQKIKEIIDSGILGQIVAINQIENVEYWHQAHSFVRGNWRNSNETSPMILQKTCHDFDLLYWMIGSRCKSVSSIGSLHYFKKENQPQGASNRCLDGKCKVKKNCPYDCEKIYIERFKNIELFPERKTSMSILRHVSVNASEENLLEALKTGPYGRCVFDCDNNVVDHQTVNLLFENGVNANLTMSAFADKGGRQVKVMGALGDLVADEHSMTITVGIYGRTSEVIDVKKLATDFSGHGGGENKLMLDFLESYEKKKFVNNYITSIDNSIESHLIAFAAEESRLNEGKKVELNELYRQGLSNK